MSPVRTCIIIGTIMMAALCLCCSRWAVARAPVNQQLVVGRYVFQMEDSGAPHHEPDSLTLKADGEYTLVHVLGGHPGSTEEGKWEILNKFQPAVAFGHRTYPVEIKGRRIRLVVNDDLGYYYEKIG